MSTSDIENLKNSKDPNEDPNFKKFFANFGITTAVIVGFVVLGSIGLYISKIAQSGILPTNPLFKPYTCDDNNIDIKPPDFIKMNIVREFGLKGLAWMIGQSAITSYCQQATFDSKAFEKTFKGGYIKKLWEATQNPNKDDKSWEPTNFALWRSDVINDMVSSSFKFIQTVFGGAAMLNESVFMLLFGLLGLTFIPFFMLYNIAISFYKHFTCLSKVGFSLTKGLPFLKPKTRFENDPKQEFGPPPEGFLTFIGINKEKKPDDITTWEKVKCGFKWFLTTIAIGCYFLVSMTCFSPVFLTFYTFFKTWAAKYKVKLDDTYSGGGASDKSASKGIFSFIRDTFAYKRSYMICLAIINLFIQCNTYLGTYYFVAVIIAVILAIVFCNIFVYKKPKNDNTLIAMKKDDESGEKDDEDLDSDSEDDCVDENDQLQVLKERIAKIARENTNANEKNVLQKQYECIELLKEVAVICNIVKDKKNIDFKNMDQVDGFTNLKESVNNLTSKYFKGDDFGRMSIILDAKDELPTQIRKLNAQIKYLTTYYTELNEAYKRCLNALDNFNSINVNESIKKIMASNKIDITDIHFFNLMEQVKDSEEAIYKIRPKLLELIAPSDEGLSGALTSPPSTTTSKTSTPSTTATATKGPDPTASVTKNTTFLSKIGITSGKKYNLRYAEKVLPLENIIKDISISLLANKNVLVDMILEPTQQTDEVIQLYITEMKDDLVQIKADTQVLNKKKHLDKKTILAPIVKPPRPPPGPPPSNPPPNAPNQLSVTSKTIQDAAAVDEEAVKADEEALKAAEEALAAQVKADEETVKADEETVKANEEAEKLKAQFPSAPETVKFPSAPQSNTENVAEAKEEERVPVSVGGSKKKSLRNRSKITMEKEEKRQPLMIRLV